MTSRVACLFPAFAMRNREFRRADFAGYFAVMETLVDRASAVVTLDRRKFDAPDDVILPDELEDDLQTQIACYIDTCAVGELFRSRFSRCDYVAGYSMGLFAALCHSGAVTFEDGLRLLREICLYAHEVATAGPYGMGAVMGLTIDEVGQVISRADCRVEVTDICGPRVLVLSGPRNDVEATLAACAKSGALNVKPIPAKLPFHSSSLKLVEPRARELVQNISVMAPRCGIVSAITQEVLTSVDAVRTEVARNVARPMNWFATMRKLLDLGVDVFLECGLSDSLTNIANRNVKGNYAIYNVGQLERFPLSQ